MQKFYYFIKTTLVLFLIISKGNVFIDTEKVDLEGKEHVASHNLYGVVDRIEDGGKAVVLVEELNKEIVILYDNYLELDLRPNTWLNVHIVNGEIVDMSIDLIKTEKERKKVKEIVDRLR